VARRWLTQAALEWGTGGVIEAQSESKELFGFDRARSISTQAANQIASAAATFGQEDDITVLGVAFAGA